MLKSGVRVEGMYVGTGNTRMLSVKNAYSNGKNACEAAGGSLLGYIIVMLLNIRKYCPRVNN